MTLTELLSCLDDVEVDALAAKAGTRAVYLHRVAKGYRKASPILCRRLVAADERLTLGELRPEVFGPIAPAQAAA